MVFGTFLVTKTWDFECELGHENLLKYHAYKICDFKVTWLTLSQPGSAAVRWMLKVLLPAPGIPQRT
jgi:hypothetical protein